MIMTYVTGTLFWCVLGYNISKTRLVCFSPPDPPYPPTPYAIVMAIKLARMPCVCIDPFGENSWLHNVTGWGWMREGGKGEVG